MADFTVDVPINLKGGNIAGGGGGKSGGDNRDQKETNKLLKKLDKTMILNIDVWEIATSLIGDMVRVLRPLFTLLSLLFFVIFLPLLPLLTRLIDGLAQFVFDVKEAGGGLSGLVKAIIKNLDSDEFIGLVAILAGMLIIAFGTGLASIGWSAIILGIVISQGDEIAQSITDSIGELWAGILGIVLVGAAGLILFAVGGWILLLVGLLTAAILVFLPELVDFGKWLWDNIIFFIFPGLGILGLLGKWLWDTITGFLSGDSGSSNPRTGGATLGPNGKIIDSIIGVNDIPSVSGQNNVTINIVKPTIRNESDIKQLANEMSRALQRQMNGRVSSIT